MTDHSQVDVLGPRYTFVNIGAKTDSSQQTGETKLVSPGRLEAALDLGEINHGVERVHRGAHRGRRR